MKTLFVNPNNRIPLGDLPAIEPPLWLSLMAAHYLEDGREVEILDAEAEDLTVTETMASVLESDPSEVIIVVMGNNPSVSSTPKMTVATQLYDTIHKLVKTHLTGLHPMAVPDTSTLPWRPARCLDLPWHLLPMDRYRAHNWHCLDGSPRSPYASVYTSLGCPFNCYYCNIHTLYHNREMLYRSPKAVVQEVETLVSKHGVRNIKIWDELFALQERRVVEICDGLAEHDLNIWAYARVDTVTENMLKAMKRGGIKWLAYGFENASLEVRDGSNKHFNARQVERAIAMTKAQGINIIGNFTFGLPGETVDSAQATLDFAVEHLFEFVNFYVALPYPGSQWFDDLKPVDEYHWFDQYGGHEHVWRTFRDAAWRAYFTNPFYLHMIESRFGRAGHKLIQDMLGHPKNKVGVI